jgi:hypothetical protein
MSKESFLDKYGTLIFSRHDYKADFDKLLSTHSAPTGLPCLPVVLIDNGPFTAAGIYYCKEELIAFSDPNDRRPKKLYMVPIGKLIEACPDLKENKEVKAILKI